MPARRFQVFGRVQGVWFRESTRKVAEPLGVTGHAINLPDGSVEVLACGDTEALKILEDWLHEGPPLSRVERVDAVDADDAAASTFTTG